LAAADLFEAAPPFPWSLQEAQNLRSIAEHWRSVNPDFSALKHWPLDANPEVLS